jgi:membrane protease YdiL (CAAX protease family)
VLYVASALGLLVPAAITAIIAYAFARGDLRSLTDNISFSALVSWSASVTIVCIAVTVAFLAWRARRGQAFSEIARRALPVTPAEYWAFAALCIVTGFCEEFLYRGYALSVLAGALQSIWLAAIVVTVFFSLNHLVQNVAGAARALLLGTIVAVPVIVTGSLWPSIIAHTLVNLFTGVFGSPLGRAFVAE